MKKRVGDLFHYIIMLLLILAPMAGRATDVDILDRKVQLDKNRGTVYQLLQQVSESSGYLFIYDSQVIDNDAVVRIPKREYTLREAIYAITRNRQLQLKVIDHHILLYMPMTLDVQPRPVTPVEENYFTLGGSLRDRVTNEPIPYGSISIESAAIGTVSNQNGDFKLILPDSLRSSSVKISHIGYQSQQIGAALLEQRSVVFYLDPELIPLQEVVVRVVDPLVVLHEMILKREQNYAQTPVYMTAFYREGINYRKKDISITEAVLKLYKSGVQNKASSDQVKLLKMRRIDDWSEQDTLLPKMKSGVNSCLLLDLMKGDIHAFLDPAEDSPYRYTHTDITTIDDRRVNVISFEPRYRGDVLYQGELYIDAENQALLQANFEIDPDCIDEATEIFLVKKNRRFNMAAQRIAYTVSYKPLNGVYYVNHVRGDLHFRVKRKKRFFSSNLHMWFEMVTCKIDTSNVTHFPRNERILTDDVFSETRFNYDKNFWGNFNTIMQEDELKESILRILNNN